MAKTGTYSTIIFVALAIGGFYSVKTLGPDRQSSSSTTQTGQAVVPGPIVNVVVPDLTGPAKIGEVAFNAKCAACHGTNAAGIDGNGPPLIHKVYEPSHHGDVAFQLAAQNGVRSHHWSFGDMPPVTGLSKSDINNIIAYVRALQRKNGIY